MPDITNYDGQLQKIARNLGEEPELTTVDALLEAIADGTENVATKEDLEDYLPLSGGTVDGDLAVTGSVTAGVGLPPVGSVTAFAGSTTPDGWLLCDGSAVSRTDYADLYAVIGDTYGDGDGSTTFNLPNLTDKFIQGNSTVGTVKSAGLPNITGTILNRYVNQGPQPVSTDGAFYSNYSSAEIMSGSSVSNTTNAYTNAILDASRSSSVYGNSNTVQPPALTMRYIIKY